MFIFEKNPKNLKKHVKISPFDGTGICNTARVKKRLSRYVGTRYPYLLVPTITYIMEATFNLSRTGHVLGT